MSGAPLFGLGEFYGAFDRRRRANGVDLSLMSARGHVDRHTHQEAHFVLVMGGAYETAATKDGAVGAMSLVYNPPGVTHRDCFASPAGRFACLSISAETVAAAREELALPERPALIPDPDTALRFYRRAISECDDLEEFALAALESAGESKSRSERAPPRWLARAVEQIDAEAPRAIPIASLAAEAGVHPVHLARAFRKFLGTTPARYGQRARLRFAYALLRRQEMSLADVADASGYADQSHFSRAFKQATGVSADRFRKGPPALS